MKTVSLLHSSQHNREKRILSNNASTLLHQLDITLSIAAVYKSQHPGFDNISTLLTITDRATLIANLHGYCSKFWNALSALLTEHLRHIIIWFITGIDGFLVTYLGSSFRLSSSSFRTPRTTANPSIIHQVTFTEVTVDPYLKALTRNYYYLLQDKMATDMQIDHPEAKMAPKTSSPSSPVNKTTVIVEDSMDIISELISEIQASDRLNLDIPIPEKVDEPSLSLQPSNAFGSPLLVRRE
jgi:hypothetical protein